MNRGQMHVHHKSTNVTREPPAALDMSECNCNEGMKSNSVDDMVETHLFAWLVQLARHAHRLHAHKLLMLCHSEASQ